MSGVKRVFVEKKKPFAVNAKELLEEIGGYLGIKTITDVRVLIRYDIENLSEETYKKALTTVFSEPPVDDVYEGTFPAGKDDFVFSVEYLPGQFDQRADSAEQCVKFFNENETPVIKTAVTYVLTGTVTDEEKNRIKEHCINPVDSRQAAEDIPETLVTEFKTPADVIYFDGFKDMPEDKLKELYDSLGLAMTFKDFKFIQEHFASVEKRDPSMTEIRVLDTYWSDHCRHTTFATELTDVKFKDGFYKAPMEATYNKYLSDRAEIYKDRKDKFVCLMDLALMGAKKLKAEGKLADQEESDEINACSIVVPVEIDGKTEEWLVNFKNETHNHPTEIEPFGGAATCLGGAIRDPLSGRTYVYQAMRITGAADPTVPVSETIHGKLPQRKLVTGAAHGYSSYGNQIGLATGYVKEIYHPDYVAKRMEIGAVIAAAPRSAVKRENSDPGDIIILLGGRTGRDGCGGATGSSKVHTEKSIEDCGAEVQKGNAPTERKMQRLFRRPEVTKLIKKCNDFGAGGVSVAIGELAAGLKVDLDKVPKKYEGLDGTELAISESQERMAVAIDKENKDEESEIKEIDEKIIIENREKENLKTQLNDNNKNLENKKIARENLKQKLDENNVKLKDIDKQFMELKESIFKVESRIEKLESNKEANNFKLFEDYNLTYLQAIELRDDEIEINKKILDTLKKDIKSLGNVNVDSIEEYKEIKERYDFYSEQKEDLQKSIEAIEEIIKDLEEHMKIQFKEEFAKINENFKYVYNRLFGGGEGNLTILDQANILESDIEITAKPPGKKMKNLSLLSGGEKALTAISILFAILLAKPTPFCILDEIEAPLDDSNIARFGTFLKELTSKTQFIAVTHRRGTMEAADYIYGVTMEQRAISKVIALSLNEAEEITDVI